MIIGILLSNAYNWKDKLIVILAALCAILPAIILHEIAHGLVALLNGDTTAKNMGRLTLNPAKHFSVFGLLMMLIVGLGWAKPVPINPDNFKKRKVGLITTSLAGVLTNLLLSFFSFGMHVAVYTIGAKVGVNSTAAFVFYEFFYYLFLYGTVINISLIAFNLLPIYPLDGFRVVEILTPPNNGYVRFMRKYSLYIFIALIAIGNTLGRYYPYCDILGTYIGWVQEGIIKLFSLIVGV